MKTTTGLFGNEIRIWNYIKEKINILIFLRRKVYFEIPIDIHPRNSIEQNNLII